jgi:signal transduction histidine kinase
MLGMKLTLKNKLILLLIVTGLIIIIMTGSIIAFNMKNSMFDIIRMDYENQLENIDFAVYKLFSEVKSNVETITSIDVVRTGDDNDFTSFLNADVKTFKYEYGEVENEIINIFNSFRITHPYINSVYMGRENGSFVRSHKRAEPTKYDPRGRPWYIAAKENLDSIVITEPYRSVTAPDINIGVEKALIDENGKFFGVVGMDVTLGNLTDYISNIEVGKGGWAMLLDENGNMLVGRDGGEQLKNISDLGQGNLEIIMEKIQGYTTFEEDSEEYYVFFNTSAETGWKICLVVPVSEINYVVWVYVISNIIILFLSLTILGILILIGLEKFVIAPIKKLSESTGLIAETGNLEHSIEIESEDEIGHLGRSFNQMMKSINKSNKALRNSEKRLRKLNDELEEKVKERTKDLARANDRLKELDRLKSMFIASMSHELRTPLNSIIGFTGLILMGMAGKINDEQKKQLLMVKSSANHLLDLVNDVIDVSKIEAGQVDLSVEDFNLSEALKEIEDSFRIMVKEKGLRLDLKAPKEIEVRGDSRRVKQIIINFVSNALKFTKKGGIEIKARRRNGRVRITVSDTGIGMKKEDIKKIFKQFSRIQARGETVVEGTGLGLYLSKKMAVLLKASVGAESVFGKGSSFYLDLPLKI